MIRLPRIPLPPSRALWMALLFAALVVGACLGLARVQPHLGFGIEATAGGAPLRVGRVSRTSSAALAEGDVIVGLYGGGRFLALRSSDLAPEPDVPFPDYAGFNTFMQRQQQLATLLRQPDLQLQLDDGTRIAVQPRQLRPIGDLPFTFWLQVFVAVASWLVGAAIWAFRREQPAARHLLITGFGMLLMAASAAVYSTRELALPGMEFRLLSSLNHGGSLICGGAFVAVLYYYPRRLGPVLYGSTPVLVYAAIWLADITQLLPFANRGVQGAIVASVLAAAILATIQWRGTRADPVRRAALQWFLLSWFIGAFGFLLLVLFPALAGIDSGEMQAYGFALMWLIPLGLALGIARYRLFDLETWWFRALGIVGGGAGVVALDLLFASLLDLSQPAALTLALAVGGWVYFPARQWLLTRLFLRAGALRVRDVPGLLRDVIADAPLEAERLLPESLRRLFAPLQLAAVASPVSETRIAGEGTTLCVPGIGRWPGWEARWPDGGNRLFNRQDVQLADAVRAVLERVVAYQLAVERSIEDERTRVAADLHDDVGARLLTLLHRAEPEQAQAIRETLASLRLVVHGLGAQPQPLAEALAEWRAELHERCEAAGVRVLWHEAEALPDWRLDAEQQLHLARVLREAVSNALRHAHPTLLEVQLDADANALLLSIANDGACKPPSTWRSGNGLRSMRSRTQKFGGELRIDAEGGRVVLRLRVPLVTPTTPYPGLTNQEPLLETRAQIERAESART